MDDGRKYCEFILGNARYVESISKEELQRVPKKKTDSLFIWRDCFIKTLIHHKMQVSDFVVVYQQFKNGNKDGILKLQILPEPLLYSKRLALIYIQALFYVTFKRDIEEEIKPKKNLFERIGIL